MNKIKGELCIIRSSSGDSDCIRIEITDKDAQVRVLDVKVDLESFTKAITSMTVNCDFTPGNLSAVGKKYIREDRKIECPPDSYDRKELENWLKENGKEDGWETDTYLGSQSSISRQGEKRILHYHVYRWEEK